MFDSERFREGDHPYFAEIIRVHGPAVRAVCRTYAESEDELDDLLQGVFTLVYRKRRSYRGDGPFAAWIYRLATNHCVSVHRARKARQRGMETFVARDGAEGLHPKSTDPGKDLERKETKRAVWKALDALPKKERQSIVLRLIEGLSPAEVAEKMKITKTSVRSNTNRGKKRLMKTMGGRDR
jgi:RNA polymerase sigma-70 factor (ECF subfamily)